VRRLFIIHEIPETDLGNIIERQLGGAMEIYECPWKPEYEESPRVDFSD